MWRGNNNPFFAHGYQKIDPTKQNGVLFQTKDIVLVASPCDTIQLNSSGQKEDCTWITKRRGSLL
jgi:hypothetical protein